MTIRASIAVSLAAALLRPICALPQTGNDLRIRVVQGENAKNDTQKRTGVAPIVEIVDEGGSPVTGAEVTFEVPASGPGGSFHGWMRAETVRTDARGVAEATEFAPNAETGEFEILVKASSEGKSGTARLKQTNEPVALQKPGPRRRQKRRKGAIIVYAAATGLTVAVTAVSIGVHRSKVGWWQAAAAAGSVLGLIAMLTKRPKARKDKVEAGGGSIEIEPMRHASLQIRAGGVVIDVDPTREAGFEQERAADLVLITSAQADHFEPEVLPRIMKTGSVVYGPAEAAQLSQLVTRIGNGEERQWREWKIEAVPAFNLPRDDRAGKVFHERGGSNGYILTYGGKRIYISGNTGDTPELRGLKDVDIAFLSMNPPYTMTHEEAAQAVRAFHPKVVYPYHYRGNLLGVFRFQNALAGTGIDVRVRNWYE